jgi:pimeloyl-ACP methyl ester carboxylesterase
MYFSTNGTMLYYIDVGQPSGPPIVLIHGFPLSHEMWSSQIEALKNVYRVVAFDLRGQGRSEGGDGQFTLEFLVDDLIALLDHLKINRAVLCGLSMGGYVSLRAVERNTQRVSGLVLCDTKSEADPNETKLARGASIRAIKRDGVEAYAESFLKGTLSPTSLKDRHVVETMAKIIRQNQALGLCGTLLALAGRTDTTSFLSKIEVPTLILVGEQDTLTPPEHSRRMQSLIQNSELHIIPKAGHMTNLENPTIFNAHLLSFLQDHVPS